MAANRGRATKNFLGGYKVKIYGKRVGVACVNFSDKKGISLGLENSFL